MSQTEMVREPGWAEEGRTTRASCRNGSIDVCGLAIIRTEGDGIAVAESARDEMIEGRVAHQTGDECSAAIQRMNLRRVVAIMGANHTTPGGACGLFSCDAPPLAGRVRGCV